MFSDIKQLSLLFFKSGKSYLEHGMHEHYIGNSIGTLNVLNRKCIYYFKL